MILLELVDEGMLAQEDDELVVCIGTEKGMLKEVSKREVASLLAATPGVRSPSGKTAQLVVVDWLTSTGILEPRDGKL